MQRKVSKILCLLLSLVMLLSIMPISAFAQNKTWVTKVVLRVTSGSIETPKYGDTVEFPTFEIASTEPAEAKDCYKISRVNIYRQTQYSVKYLKEGDTYDEDIYRLLVGITEKEEGAGNAYTLGPSTMYILQGEDEIRLTSASGSSSSQNSYLEYDVKSPDGIMPTITTTEFDNYVVDHSVYIGLQARGSKPITWTATGLPKGLTISDNGAISGRPKQAGAFNVKITATNAAGSVTKSIPMRVSNSDDTKVEIKSIVIDFEETPKTPFVGGAPNNQTFKVISTEPAHAMSSVSVISYWSDASGTMLNALNTYQLGDYFLYIGLNSQNKIYTATENTKVYLGSTLLTNDLAKDFGSIYTGYLKFNTKLSNKPTNLSIEGTYTFNGKIQSPVIPGYDSSTMQLIGAAHKDAGSYLVTVKPWYKWADGTKDEIKLSWTINPFNITTAGVLDIKTGINKYTGTEQEVNIESVKATINREAYTLERGVDYALGGDCTTWTDIGLAGGTTSKGFVIKGIGNFTGLSGNQIWLISKGDPAPLNFTVEAPTTPGGKGAVIGTTAAMVYLKSGMAYELKCSEGRTELYPGTYIIGKNADKYYNAVSQVVVIPEYDSSGDVRVLGVSLDKSTITLKKGKTETLTATINPSNATHKTINWTSDDTSVVTVDNGVITAVSPGAAIVTATTIDGNKTASCDVVVTAEIYSVTFVGGDGATGTAPTETPKTEGMKFNLPDCTFTKENHVFDGWNDGTKTYSENDEYTMPEKDVTFTAIWKHIHSISAIAKVDATHFAEGKNEYYKCSTCGNFYEDAAGTKPIADINTWGIIEKTPHDFAPANCTAPKTCKIAGCGHTEGTALGHTGGTATCKDKAVCTRCSTPYGEKNPSNHAGGTEVVNKKDAVHKTQTKGYTGDTKCLGCNAIISTGTDIAPTAHTPATTYTHNSTHHWKTCTVDGCGVEIAGSKVAHTPGAAATETTPQTCTACGYVIKPALGHTCKPVTIPGKAATCSEKGLTDGKKCSECGTIIEPQIEIPTIGHDYTEVITKPTCTEGGYTTRTCKNCGHVVKDDETLAKGHTPSDWIVEKAATADAEGLEIKKCTVCEAKLEEKITPKLTTEYMPGDINGDKKVTATDARLILRIATKLEKLEDQNVTVFAAADVNGDGKITATDARKVLRVATKLEKF